MAVKPGYKQTEMGVVPEVWEVCHLSDISTKITDGDHITPKRTRHGYYLLSARNVLNGAIDVSDVDYVGDEEYFRMKRRCGPEAGDILISCSGTIGRVTVVPAGFECVLVRSAALAKLDRGKADAYYIQYWLQSNQAQVQIANSVNQGAQPNLFLNHIERLQCPRPPLQEQHSIAAALSDVDALLGALKRLIAKKRDLKQATMQQLLTGKIRLPGFHREWEFKALGDLGSTFGGLTGKTKADFGEGSGQYVTFMNVISNVVINCDAFERVKVSPTESQNRVMKGDLLFNGSSETPEEVALCSVLAEDVDNLFLNSFCFGFRFRETVETDGLFLAYYLRSKSGREMMKSLAQGSTRYNLSKVALLKSLLRLPQLPEQKAIASVLADMDAELAALEQRQAKTLALKQGMMQELLTGRTRLL